MSNQSPHAKKVNVSGLKKAIGTNSVVKYYAPWCGYCRQMASDYGKLSDMAAIEVPNVHVLRFNMDKHAAEVQDSRVGEEEFGVPIKDDVKGFPTVIMYRADGTRSLYKGPRTTQAMIDTMKAYYA